MMVLGLSAVLGCHGSEERLTVTAVPLLSASEEAAITPPMASAYGIAATSVPPAEVRPRRKR